MVTYKNCINNTIGGTAAGVSNTLTITNPSNTASSSAKLQLTLSTTGPVALINTFHDANNLVSWSMGVWGTDENFNIENLPNIAGTSNLWNTRYNLPTITTTLQSYIDVQLTGDQTITSATLTTIIYDTAFQDNQGEYNNSTGIFTATEPGIYNVNANIPFSTSATATSVDGYIVVNSTNAQSNRINVTAVSATYYIPLSFNVKLSASDTIKIQVYQTGGVLDGTVFAHHMYIVKVA